MTRLGPVLKSRNVAAWVPLLYILNYSLEVSLEMFCIVENVGNKCKQLMNVQKTHKELIEKSLLIPPVVMFMQTVHEFTKIIELEQKLEPKSRINNRMYSHQDSN